MIEKILFGVGMLVVTLLLQFFLHKSGRGVSFWSGVEIAFIMGVLGLVTNDTSYFAGIVGFAAGDQIGKFVGWHKVEDKKE